MLKQVSKAKTSAYQTYPVTGLQQLRSLQGQDFSQSEVSKARTLAIQKALMPGLQPIRGLTGQDFSIYEVSKAVTFLCFGI